MKSLKNILLGGLVVVSAYSCKPNLEQFLPTAGEADFSSYVAIGNSLTSGYADNALRYTGQQNSFPVMLANQFEQAGGGVFNVPYLPQGNGVGLGPNSTTITQRILGYVTDCEGTTGLSPVLAGGSPAALTNVSAGGPYNLVGVPGVAAFQSLNGLYSLGNPYFSRFASQPGSSTLLSEALRNNPTFFTLWLGNNDILSFALGGGTGAIDPVNPNVFGGDLIAPSMVDTVLTVFVDSLTNRGAKGVIATIPDITSIPFFTTIPYNGVVLTQQEADDLNVTYSNLGLSNITWKEGANPFIVEDTTVIHPSLRVRQATANELILLSVNSDSLKCAGWGVNPFKALKDESFLDAKEVATIKQHTIDYNTAIRNIASNYDIALADMNAYMSNFKSGIVYNGMALNSTFVTGGAFSLDGVHPNPRGYALVANEFIRVINAKYKSTLAEVDVTSYNGILFP